MSSKFRSFICCDEPTYLKILKMFELSSISTWNSILIMIFKDQNYVYFVLKRYFQTYLHASMNSMPSCEIFFSREFHFHYSLLLIGFKLQIFIDILTEAWYECFVGLFFILSFKMNPYLFLIEKSSQVASCNTFFFLKTYFNESRSNWFILKLSKNYYVRTF